MTHFDITHWTDFARGTITAAQRARQQRHLDTGCARCRALLTSVEAILEAANTRLDAPPDAVMARAIDIFDRTPSKTESVAAKLLARLTFDSYTAPLAMGVRASAAAGRHLLFEAGPFDIDVRLEYDANSSRVGLVGQIANHENPSAPVARVPVVISAGQSVVAQTTANEFGEFHLDYHHQDDVLLRVPVSASGPVVEVSLGHFREQATRPTTPKGRRH